jgi:hypothetical protein
VKPRSQISGFLQSGHHSAPIAAGAARERCVSFGLSSKNTMVIRMAGAAQTKKLSRQLPPTSGRTNGMVSTGGRIAPMTMPFE